MIPIKGRGLMNQGSGLGSKVHGLGHLLGYTGVGLNIICDLGYPGFLYDPFDAMTNKC